MFITVADVFTHLYPESIAAISGTDERLLAMALDAGTLEVKGYLHRFDTDTLFAATGDERNALLLLFTKDVAVWHYINIANPSIDMDVREKRYNAAIAWLRGVQKGSIIPDFPPTLTDEGKADIQIKIGSNPKRGNYI